jgi:hypothetical protein
LLSVVGTGWLAGLSIVTFRADGMPSRTLLTSARESLRASCVLQYGMPQSSPKY